MDYSNNNIKKNPLSIEVRNRKEYWDHCLILDDKCISTSWNPIEQLDLDWYVQTQLMNNLLPKNIEIRSYKVYNVLKWGQDLIKQ